MSISKVKAMEMYIDGVHVEEIASVCGTTPKKIYYMAERLGITRRGRKIFRYHVQRDEIVEAYAAGRSCGWIWRIYRVSTHALRRWVTEAGHTWRPRQMVDSAKALELYQRLGTYAAVAEVMDLSPEGARRAVIRGRKSAQSHVVQYSRAAVKAVQTRHVTARAGSSDRARGSAVTSRG